jgi:hypothetical protein
MKKVLIILSFFIPLQSCTSAYDELNDQIETALNSGSEVSAEEASAMKIFILANQKDIIECNKSLVNGETVTDDELLKLIKKSKVYRKLSKAGEVKIDLSGTGTKTAVAVNEIMPKLYLERSGSMVFYDSPQGSGDFRNVLTSLLSNFNSINNKKNIIYVVNDNVYDCPLDFKGLVQSKNIFVATKIGNETFTDFDLIFKRILVDLKQGEVSILLSDLIYSTPSMNGVSNTKILNAAEKLTLNVFQGFSKDISVLVLKFNGDYNGRYYPHNQSPQKYSGSRPYYAVLFAKNETMNKFMNDEKYSKIRTWKDYTNFENFYFFSNDDKVKNPFYTIRLKDPDKAGRYNQESDEKKLHEKGIHSIEDINHDKDGKLSINIVVDLSNLHIPIDIKVDKNNYVVESNQDFVVEKITSLDGNAEGTHKITISTEKKRGGNRNVSIKFKKIFPPRWIKDSHSDNDTDIKKGSFSSTTFGIQNMMQGIHQAYDTDQSEYLFSLKINLKN